MGEVTDQVTAATIVAIPKDTTPTTFQSISGFALPSVRDSQQSTSPIGFLFRHCLVRQYWYRTYVALIPVTKPHHASKKVRLRKDWGFWPRAPQQCPRKLHWRAWHLQHYWKSRTRNLIIGVRWLNSSKLDELGMVSRARIFVGRFDFSTFLGKQCVGCPTVELAGVTVFSLQHRWRNQAWVDPDTFDEDATQCIPMWGYMTWLYLILCGYVSVILCVNLTGFESNGSD